ncbi:MAG: hypothetical protein IKA90_06945, partial [Clostridia bacterium]|nr:hypothetical protein [Clostridia bacterium]
VFGMNHTSEPVNLATVDTQDEIIECEMTYSNGIELFMSSAVVEGETLEQTIEAIVVPHYAKNTEVDWALAWANPEGEFEVANDVADFMSIVPESDGSKVATLIVYDSFANHDIAITCFTRVGNKKGTIVAHYVGLPTMMDEDSLQISVLPNTITSAEFHLYNIFGNSTQEYINDFADFEVTVTPVGRLMLQQYWVAIEESDRYRDPYEVSLSDLASQCDVSAVVVDGVLKITSTNAIESYYKRAIDPPSPLPMEYLRAYVYCSGVENCYWLVELTDKTSGLSCSFEVRIYSDPESVETVDDTVLF